MKRPLLLLGLVVSLGLLSSLAWATASQALNVRTGDKPQVSKDEVVDGTLYTAGNIITIDGTVHGDVFCAGRDIVITGTVEGDVICAGQTVNVSGKVQGDVRLAGQQVDLSAEVGGSASLAGETVALHSETKVGRDLTVGGTGVQVDGQVGRDVVGGAQAITLAGSVGRNVDVELQSLAVGARARVGGNLTYKSTDEAIISDGATITGATNHIQAQGYPAVNANAVRFWSAAFGFGSMIVIGLAALVLAPRWFDGVGAPVRKRPILAFACGGAALLVTPLAAALLLISLVGIPLGIMLLLLWVAALIGSTAVAAYSIGWIIVEKMAWPSRGQRVASLVMGALLLLLLGMIPYVGGVITFIALLLGLGSLTLDFSQHINADKTKKRKVAA